MTKQDNIQYFNQNISNWIKDPIMQNKFVVISNKEIKAQFDSFESALDYAVKKCDVNEFIIQQIIDEKTTNNFIISA